MKPKHKQKIWIAVIILALIGAVAIWWWFGNGQVVTPEWELDMQINKSPIDNIVPAVEGTIVLLHNGEPVSKEISKNWGIYSGPKTKVSVKPIMNDNDSRLPPDTPKLLTYMSSPQATSEWNYDFEDGSDVIVGTMYFGNDGRIEFNYVYGASHLYPLVEFNFDVVITAGLTISANQTIDFGKLAGAITNVPNINQQTRGSFYYDVSFEPSYKPIAISNGRYGGLVREMSVNITARNSITNQVIDNPHQRVQVEFYPIYMMDDFDTSFELAGYSSEDAGRRFLYGNHYLAETFKQNSWYAYNEIPRDSLPLGDRGNIVEIDLIDGEGRVIYGPNNHYADIKMLEIELPEEFEDQLNKIIGTAQIDEELIKKIIPSILVVVRPANYGQLEFSVCSDLSPHNLIKNPNPDDGMSGPEPLGGYLGGKSSYRYENKICYPDRPEPKDEYTFLYKTWQKNDLLTDRIYTVATLPLWSNASTVSDKIIEIISDFTEQVKRFNFWMWFIVSQIAQLIIGGLMIVIKRRNELRQRQLSK